MGELWRKLKRVLRRDELAERLREELQFHTEMKGAGIGNCARILEQADDVWTLGRVETIAADLRYSMRAMRRAPAFFILAAVGTALGVAAITAVVSVGDTVLVRSIPYRDAGRLVIVSDQLLALNFPRFPISVANFQDYRTRNGVFTEIAAFEPRAVTVTFDDHAERVAAMMASANLPALLGATPAFGRWFSTGENHRDGGNVAVVSYSFWQSHLGAGGDALGKSLRVNDQPYQVVGVMPAGFTFRLSGDAPEVWLPANLDPGPRDAGNLSAIARLRPDVTLAAAQARMHGIAADLKERYHAGMGPHGEDGRYDVVVVPLRDELYGAVRPTLFALAGASGILMILGLANTALLWIGRAAARRKEASVRLALGASRWRVMQQLILEALLPSLAGGALALLLAFGALTALNQAPPRELSTVDTFTLDYRVFGFALLISTAAGVLFGTLPVRQLLYVPVDQDRGAVSNRAESRWRQAMVAIQVAVVCALLGPALLLLQSLSALESVDPGVRTHRLITGYVSVPGTHAPDAVAWFRRLEDTIHARLGADRVTLASVLPLSQGDGGDPFSIEGRDYGTSSTLPQMAHTLRIGQGYFDLMRVRLYAGRPFEPRDFLDPTHVAIVNQTAANVFWKEESPLGKRLLMGAVRPGAQWMTIVGVAADIHTTDLSQAPLPQIYFPYSQWPTRTMALIVDGNRGADLSAAVHAADPAVPVFSIRSMEQRVSESVERPRLRTQIFATYGALALALSAFGIYSMAVYTALRRRREFAVRAALGATRGRLLATILGGTLTASAAGAAVGVAVSYAIARALASFLYGTQAASPGVYLLSAGLALAVAGFASTGGCRQAITSDPAEVLRSE